MPELTAKQKEHLSFFHQVDEEKFKDVQADLFNILVDPKKGQDEKFIAKLKTFIPKDMDVILDEKNNIVLTSERDPDIEWVYRGKSLFQVIHQSWDWDRKRKKLKD